VSVSIDRGAHEEAILSREELDALLEEMPQLLADEEEEAVRPWSRSVDLELQRANEAFAAEQAQTLSNRHQRVIGISLIGHREIELPELAEIMLPTDLVASFRVLPKGFDGYLLLSRPLFFQLLSMSFGAGPTIKPTRPPVREYSRIERRFYTRAAREMLGLIESAWSSVAPVKLEYLGLSGRTSVSESEPAPVVLATFEVKGFGEPCRIRMAIPAECFSKAAALPEGSRVRTKRGPELSVESVPIPMRAEVGSTVMTLAQIGRLREGDILPLDTPSDGSLTIRIGHQAKFKAIAGTQGAKRAVQLIDRIEGLE
jgi:flagellar motor switch protein FliM